MGVWVGCTTGPGVGVGFEVVGFSVVAIEVGFWVGFTTGLGVGVGFGWGEWIHRRFTYLDSGITESIYDSGSYDSLSPEDST